MRVKDLLGKKYLLIYSISIFLIASGVVIQSGKLSTYELENGLVTQKHNSIVIYPLFTQIAYQKGGFYDYYLGNCDQSCLTLPIKNDLQQGSYSSQYGYLTLKQLGYNFITDLDVDKNPTILKQYDTVILLHNEYVTKTEFNAITSHPKVILLYPNALYAEVRNNNDQSITLIKGHEYPTNKTSNGFGWIYDNSKYEYRTCQGITWTISHRDNIYQLWCNPEQTIHHDSSIWSYLDQLQS